MTGINDLYFDMNYFGGVGTSSFSRFSFLDTPIFNGFTMPMNSFFPQFNFNFELPLFNYNNAFIPQNNNDTKIESNLKTSIFPTPAAPLPSLAEQFNQNTDFAIKTNMFDTFTPSGKVFTSMAEKTKKMVEKKPETKMALGSYKTFKFSEYNAEKGEKLAKEVTKGLSSAKTGYCAMAVKKGIVKAGLGSYESGHAYQMTEILRKNNNFKEVSPSSVDIKNLPAGCILVYGKNNNSGYSKTYGHVEVTRGDTTAASFCVTNNIRPNPEAVFIPV